ncbi:MAG: hypothetical protein IJQ65_02425 [Kiritimatiellae bacterium]|nr:hypothetical protein [Kiritimatiellia bacterium]
MTPTIEQVMKCYRMVAQTERMKTGRPGKGTVANSLRGAENVCRAAAIELTSPVTALTRRRIDAALASFMDRGLSRISAWSYVCQLRGVFAKWCKPYYIDAGWEIPPIDLPTFLAKAPHYTRPSAELLRRVKAWYGRQTGEHWFAATMMLEFAMRNGDVLRLKSENFIEKDGRRYLDYTPHKTELTSGRRVCWPIHDDIWRKLDDYGGLACLDVTKEIFSDINRSLRAIGFRGSKGAYELRKICIDHVYQKYGAELAVSISGDDIKTITRYYADPAQPNIGAVRIIDLL